MSESTTEVTEAPAQEAETDDAPVDLEAEVARLREEVAKGRKWEQRAKENTAKALELEKQRKAAMTEAERKEAEAEERGRTAAITEFGRRLATAEIRAAAAAAGANIAGVFDYLDLSRFVGDDGEPDAKAIKAFVEAQPRLDDNTVRAPRPDRNQGRSNGSASTADQFAASIDGLL